MESKIQKFFKEYGFVEHGTDELHSGHLGHAKTDYYHSRQPITFLHDNSEYIFVNPISGTKIYSLDDAETGRTLCDGHIRVMGFSQQQFIDNVKQYFKLGTK